MRPFFALDESLVRRLVLDTTDNAIPPGTEADAAAERSAVADAFARAAWTGIAEPGDSVAGRLIALLGAAPALDAVLAAESGESFVGAILDRRAEDTAGRSRESAVLFIDGELEAALARWRPRLISHDAIAAFRHARTLTIRLLTPRMPDWPASLSDLGAHGPPALWLRGASDTLTRLGRSVALVGARAATGYGEHLTVEVAAGLCDRGVAIVSGAAYGIDGVAHRTALASGGATVAFLAGGVDRYYPSGHHTLLERIAAVGAVVSELPPGAAPTRWRFLQRNRLIAAASSATVVVEAGIRSGSLNTAGHAATLGRPLGAVPGPVTSPSSAGCHRLIRELDAVCVTTAGEVVELLGLDQAESIESTWADGGAVAEADVGEGAAAAARGSSPADATTASPDRPAVQIRLLDALSFRADRSTADLARRSGLAVADVESTLGVLELDGEVTESSAGWRRKRAQ